MSEDHTAAIRPARRERLHPVTRGVLIAWALGIAKFAYFGVLLGIEVGGGS